MLTFWATLAESLLLEDIWQDTYEFAVKLYVAHEVAIAANNLKASQGSGTPGTFGGIASQKAVGGASISYDQSTTTEKNAGWWNMTIYGRQLYRLIRMFGAGCVQL